MTDPIAIQQMIALGLDVPTELHSTRNAAHIASDYLDAPALLVRDVFRRHAEPVSLLLLSA